MDDIQRYGGGVAPISIDHEDVETWEYGLRGSRVTYGQCDDHSHGPEGCGWAGGCAGATEAGYGEAGGAIQGLSVGSAMGAREYPYG